MINNLINETIYHCAFRMIDEESNIVFKKNIEQLESSINDTTLDDEQKNLIIKLILASRIDEYINFILDGVS